jgi:hypothetical protein
VISDELIDRIAGEIQEVLDRHWQELAPTDDDAEDLEPEQLGALGSAYAAAWALELVVSTIEDPTISMHTTVAPAGQLGVTTAGVFHRAWGRWS